MRWCFGKKAKKDLGENKNRNGRRELRMKHCGCSKGHDPGFERVLVAAVNDVRW